MSASPMHSRSVARNLRYRSGSPRNARLTIASVSSGGRRLLRARVRACMNRVASRMARNVGIATGRSRRPGGAGACGARCSLSRRSGYCPLMGDRRDSRVDAYIDQLPEWQQTICRRVRDLIHEADPEVEETIKRTVQPYFVLNGNVAALLATKDHVNVFLYDPIAPDPEGIITAGHEN